MGIWCKGLRLGKSGVSLITDKAAASWRVFAGTSAEPSVGMGMRGAEARHDSVITLSRGGGRWAAAIYVHLYICMCVCAHISRRRRRRRLIPRCRMGTRRALCQHPRARPPAEQSLSVSPACPRRAVPGPVPVPAARCHCRRGGRAMGAAG